MLDYETPNTGPREDPYVTARIFENWILVFVIIAIAAFAIGCVVVGLFLDRLSSSPG